MPVYRKTPVAFLCLLISFVSIGAKDKPVENFDIKPYVDGLTETPEAATLHRDIDCLGFKPNREGKPYVLLRIKDFEAYKALMDGGEIAFVIWINGAKEVATSVTYYNPHSKKVMILTGSSEKQLELPKFPFPAGFLLENGYKPFTERMFLIHTPKKHPGTQYASCQ